MGPEKFQTGFRGNGLQADALAKVYFTGIKIAEAAVVPSVDFCGVPVTGAVAYVFESKLPNMLDLALARFAFPKLNGRAPALREVNAFLAAFDVSIVPAELGGVLFRRTFAAGEQREIRVCDARSERVSSGPNGVFAVSDGVRRTMSLLTIAEIGVVDQMTRGGVVIATPSGSHYVGRTVVVPRAAYLQAVEPKDLDTSTRALIGALNFRPVVVTE